jgi:hypothetical protein
MKQFTFLLILVMTLLFTACIQPAAAPVAATTGGLEILDPWARQAQMRSENAMDSAAMTNTMTNTVGMHNATAMTATAAMSSTPMTGTMGMGMGGAMGAMYMTIRNTTGTPDRLIKAHSDVSKVVELHNVAMKDGVMSMYPVEAIDIPANGETVLKPGSFHVMLIGLTRDLVVGETMTVTLTFEQAGDVTLQAPIRER